MNAVRNCWAALHVQQEATAVPVAGVAAGASSGRWVPASYVIKVDTPRQVLMLSAVDVNTYSAVALGVF